jgi:hypothetical protein
MVRPFLLVLLLAGCTAAASPRLFPEVAPFSLAPELKAEEPRAEVLVATGAASSFFATPGTLLLSSGLGKVSNNLYAAALPSLLLTLLLPPLAVVFSEWMAAERVSPGRFRWLPALGVAVLTQALLIAGAALLGVSGTNSGGVALFTLADVVALPTVSTAMLKWTERSPAVNVPVVAARF